MVNIKRGIYTFTLIMVIIILTVSMTSAGILKDFYAKITGKADTANVGLNITVSSGNAPKIIQIWNETDISNTFYEGPTATYITVTFNVSDSDGVGNLNNASAKVNVTSWDGLSATRENTSCLWVVGQSGIKFANYSCNITMWWWDQPGTWTISAYIIDANNNIAYNHTIQNFTVAAVSGLGINTTTLNWSTISPGVSNLKATDIIQINNTGNQNRSVYVNASDLIGETTATQALGAVNFSANNVASCDGTSTSMVNMTDTNITATALPRGNYTYNNGTAQEILYFCLEQANAELSAQSYSTAAIGPWQIKVGA